jgi:cation diffusion facilitator family transporter
MQQRDRYRQAKKVTLLGAAVNAFLGISKVIGGLFLHSHALVADGIHSFSDLFTDGTVLFASKYGSQIADESHPYGHQRIETAATLLLALILILAGIGIVWDSVNEMIEKTHDIPGLLTIPLAALSIIANELLFHYTRHVGHRINSELIIANAWHHRSDAASSIVVLIGLIGSVAGIIYLDAIAAVIVGLMIIKMGWTYGWNSVKELVDTAVETKMLTTIEHIISDVNGVQKIHQLRSRMMGPDIFIDVHVQVSPYISVSEGHFIAQHVHDRLVNEVKQIKDVTVHVDPEDDEIASPSLHLPNRGVLEETLLKHWRDTCPNIQSVTLHYLDGELTLDLSFDEPFTKSQSLPALIKADLMDYPQIKTVRLYALHDKINNNTN